jgi:hypothetical protein
MVFVIKAFIINSEFSLYIKLLSVKVYIIVFIRELIKVIYLSLVFMFITFIFNNTKDYYYCCLRYLIVLCFFISLLF